MRAYLLYDIKYNDQGIRTEKTVNGVTTKYYLLGDKVILETNGTDTIHYTYDNQDNLVSMNLNGVEYYYVRNGQGDIIALIDANGYEVVTYTYDSWGKIISIDGDLATTVGIKNPYRYRGYRYDEETKLYYLQSRYYNPEWGRFVNADAIAGNDGELLSHNLYVYAQNNPVVKIDPSGFVWETIFDVVNIGISTVEFVKNPSLRNAAFLAWDIGAAVLPCVPGSYIVKGINKISKADIFKRLGRLRIIGPNKWISTAGLVYTLGSVDGNRFKHILVHAKDSGMKGKSLFNINKDKVLRLVDEAWINKRGYYINRGNDVYDIPMGRVIGTQGETTIRIITKHGTNEILTAYPIK